MPINTKNLHRSGSVLAALLMLIAGCKTSAGDQRKLAEVNGVVVTASDLDKHAGKALAQQRHKLYSIEKEKLDEYVGGVLLSQEAGKRNISVATLLEQEVNKKVKPVSDDDIAKFYEENKARLPVELEKVKEQIREHLGNQRLAAQKANFFDSLRKNASVNIYLQPPPVFRVNVTTTGAPSKGDPKAPVTLIKFEDFQCPFCKQVQPTFLKLLEKYDGKLRLVHKDLPLDSIHPQARQAAEAARCADEQGKFWEYHNLLYDKAPKFGLVELKTYAEEVGLEVESFRSCYNTGKYKKLVQRDYNEGADLGITGTPTFFINGREFSGNQPVEAFSAIIEEELARVK